MSTDTPDERGVTTISTTPQQALCGTEIGVGSMATCGACGRSIGEGSEVAVAAHRMSDEARWTVARVVCAGCIETHGTIHTPTAGCVELRLAGRLALRADAAYQSHRLVFEPEEGRGALLDYSGPESGSAP